jgi:hypothetical protein
LLRSAQDENDGGQGNSAGFAPAPATATYRIASPRPGEEVNGVVQIVGTASFNPEAIQYYKLEIGSGTNPGEWVTLGTTHSQPVQNGVLEELHTDALAPGPYVIRLVLVRNDGNFPAPHAVPITIVE